MSLSVITRQSAHSRLFPIADDEMFVAVSPEATPMDNTRAATNPTTPAPPASAMSSNQTLMIGALILVGLWWYSSQ